MAKIYQHAQKVIVWVGNAGEGSEVAMDFFIRLTDQGQTISPFLLDHLGYRSAMCVQLHDLLSRPWFSRVWTLQEAAVATDCVVQCGLQQIPFAAFERFNRNCQHDETGQWSNVLSAIATARAGDSEHIKRFITAHINEIENLKAAYQAQAPVESLTLALERHRNCGCTVDLDRIYAIWAFLPPEVTGAIGSPTYGNYTRAQLYTDVARAELVRQSWPEHLGAAGRARQKRRFRTTAPSWVPDWTYPQRHHTFWLLDRDCRAKTSELLYQATYDDPAAFIPTLQSRQLLRVRGKILDTIVEHASPFSFPTPGFQQRITHMNKLRATIPLTAEILQELQSLELSVSAEVKAFIEGRLKQITDCVNLAIAHCGESFYPSSSSDVSTKIAAYHTLLGGAKPFHAQPGQFSSSSLGGVSVRASDEDVRYASEHLTVEPQWLDQVQNACKDRVFFVTGERKYFGLGPGYFAFEEEEAAAPKECATRKGDRICVVRGCATPFVVRPVEERDGIVAYWELVGECYVHGLMDGEGFKGSWGDVREEDIVFG